MTYKKRERAALFFYLYQTYAFLLVTCCHSEPAEESPKKSSNILLMEAPPCGDKRQPDKMRVGCRARIDLFKTNKTLAFCQKRTSTLLERKMRPRPRPLVPTLTYLSRTKFCASGKICSVAPLPTKGSPFAGSLNTQRPCFRVSSSCRQYEVFGNFAWRSAPPRKRVTQ